MKRRLLKFEQAGDTIVEVMLAITIFGLALGTAYALSHRAYLTAGHTRDRIAATSLAQGQVEFLKNIGLEGGMGTFIATLTPEPFCFDDANATKVSGNACTNYKGSIYNMSITYCDGAVCSPADVFTVKTTWIAGGSGKQYQLTLYYKPQT